MIYSVAMSNGDIYSGELVKQEFIELYRKPHDIEIKDYDTKQWQYMGDGYRLGKVRDTVIGDPIRNPSQKPMPEVYRVYPDHQTPISCGWQWFWRDLNPELTDEAWSSLLGSSLAWTNNTGFPGRMNCILHEDLDSKLPAFDAPRVNGGATLKRKKTTNDGIFWIDGLLTTDEIPDATDVINNKPWLWFYGTSVRRDGGINYIMRMGKDGNLKKVRVPILSRLPIYTYDSFLDKLKDGIILEATQFA